MSKNPNSQVIQPSTSPVQASNWKTRLLFSSFSLLTRLFTRFEVKMKEPLPAEPLILAANHLTFIDSLWVASLLSKERRLKVKAVAGADLATNYGYIGKLLCHAFPTILVERKGNPTAGLLQARRHLLAKRDLIIHPEGSRSRSGLLLPLHNGAAYLAYKTKSVLVPIYLEGAFEIFGPQLKFPKPLKGFRRKKLVVHVGKALDPRDYSDFEALTSALDHWLHEQEQRYASPFLLSGEKGETDRE